MKRALIIAYNDLNKSGVPYVIMSTVRCLKDDYRFDIVVFEKEKSFYEDEFLSYGGNIYRCIFPSFDNSTKRRFWRLFCYEKYIKDFIKQNINLSQYEVIHSFLEADSYPFLKCAKKYKNIKKILHLNAAFLAYPIKRNIKTTNYLSKLSKSFKHSDTVICVSEMMAKQIKQNNKKVVYTPIPKDDYKVIEKKYNLSKLSLTLIGTFSGRKNQLFALKVLKSLIEKGLDAELNLIGDERESNYLSEMKQYIKDNNLDNNAHLYDADTNQDDIYSKTDYVLYPSTMESFGLVAVEAQMRGVHVFASNVIPTETDIGNASYLELDADIWADKIKSFYRSNGHARKELEINPFSSDAFKQQLLDIYSNFNH